MRKDGFMELHMSGDKNSFGRWFKTEVGTLGLRIAKKDAGFGSWFKFMFGVWS